MVYTDNSKILPNNIDLLECDAEYVGTVFLPFRFKFKHESCFSTFQNKVAAAAIHYKIKNFFMSVPMFFCIKNWYILAIQNFYNTMLTCGCDTFQVLRSKL